MSDSLDRDELYARISDDNLVETGAGWISFVGSFDIGSQQVADTGDLSDQVKNDLFRPPTGALAPVSASS